MTVTCCRSSTSQISEFIQILTTPRLSTTSRCSSWSAPPRGSRTSTWCAWRARRVSRWRACRGATWRAGAGGPRPASTASCSRWYCSLIGHCTTILTSDWCRRSRCRCGSRSGAARRCSSSSATPTRCPPPRCVPGPRAGTPAMWAADSQLGSAWDGTFAALSMFQGDGGGPLVCEQDGQWYQVQGFRT